jgi:glutamyl-tRNA(Gln) amidotransferase subunit E
MKAGLEIHQQLNTREKLFCSCPSILSDKVSKRILRKLRAVAGETGEIDVAAHYEQTKGKYMEYEYDNSYACLVELDEEPPHLINEEALKISLILAEFFGMRVPSVLQVMRKTVVDGSNTSGFQRTVLIGLNGELNLNGKNITIQTLCLEEDAARKINETEDKIIYRLDRLGIPLVEIATGPELESPEEVKECAKKIGLILRLTRKVKRGLGTIRQDINISIPEGEKIEIKGAQDLDIIPDIVRNEVERQKKLLEWQKLVKERGIEKIIIED